MTTEKEKEYGRRWRAANQKRIKRNRRRYSAANREKIREATAAWTAANPERRVAYGRLYRAKNRSAIKVKRAAHYQKTKLAQQDKILRAKYGISLQQKREMLLAQDGCCVLCLTVNPSGKGWVVDHDHSTGKVRGILCPTCNTGLGLLRDDEVVLQRAIFYLRKHR